jgi:hypothetical protein
MYTQTKGKEILMELHYQSYQRLNIQNEKKKIIPKKLSLNKWSTYVNVFKFQILNDKKDTAVCTILG